MRIALVSDIHGNLPALDAVLADLAARGITRVLNLGDHVSGPLWPRETAARLLELGWTSIRGNHDRQVVEGDASRDSDRHALEQLAPAQLEWLRGLPSNETVFDEGKLLLVHGTPESDLAYLLETPLGGWLRLAAQGEIGKALGQVAAPVVACGHSHVPRVVRTAGGTTIVNPGSVGLQAYTAEHPEPHVSETGSPHARYAILERGGDRWTATLVALDYDWERAAVRAEQNGRQEWAYSLRTGYAPVPR
jgi:predicted phosphodiesterase